MCFGSKSDPKPSSRSLEASEPKPKQISYAQCKCCGVQVIFARGCENCSFTKCTKCKRCSAHCEEHCQKNYDHNRDSCFRCIAEDTRADHDRRVREIEKNVDKLMSGSRLSSRNNTRR